MSHTFHVCSVKCGLSPHFVCLHTWQTNSRLVFHAVNSTENENNGSHLHSFMFLVVRPVTLDLPFLSSVGHRRPYKEIVIPCLHPLTQAKQWRGANVCQQTGEPAVKAGEQTEHVVTVCGCSNSDCAAERMEGQQHC